MFKNKFYISQRYVLIFLLCLGLLLEYLMRNCLSIAIVKIVIRKFDNESIVSGDICPPDDEDLVTDDDYIGGDYDWSEELQGLILSSFYFGYLITQIPGGWLSEKFGGKVVFLTGSLLTVIFTFLTPVSIEIGGANLLITVRVLLGLSQGLMYPAIYSLATNWIPLRSRMLGFGIIYNGMTLGAIFSTALTGILIKHTGTWSVPFYIYGSIGVIWCLLFGIICSKDPQSNRFISDEEKDYLSREIKDKQVESQMKVPYKSILCSLPVWAIVVMQSSDTFALYLIIADLPKYFHLLGFNIENNGLYNALPQVATFTSVLIFGYVCDQIINRRYLSTKNTRKLFTFIGEVGYAILLVMTSYAGCDRILAVVLMVFAVGFSGMNNSRVNNMDLSPNFAATIISISNTFVSIMGILAPNIVGLLAPNGSIIEWKIVFWVTFGFMIFASIFYVIFADGEVQPWNESVARKTNRKKETSSDIPIKLKSSKSINLFTLRGGN